MAKPLVKIPRLPKQLYEPNVGWTIGLLSWGLLLFFGFGYVNYLIVYSEWPLYLQAPLLCFGALMSGQGLHILGNTGHEGFHFTLHRNKDVSASIGVFFSAATVFHIDVGFSFTHWNHHLFTNTGRDPDIRIFTRFKNPITRTLLARGAALQVYAWDTLKLAFNQPLTDKVSFPMPIEKIRRYARFNFLAAAFWFSLYGTLFVFFPKFFVVFISCAFVALNTIASLRPYFEHAGLGFGKLEKTRTYSHPLWSLFCTNINFHMEHHLFPTVPFFNLGKVHALLQQHNVLADNQLQVVETGFWRPLKLALQATYPEPDATAIEDQLVVAEQGSPCT